MTDPESLRLDKWLWSARFFKTRKLAADAIIGGKVHLNGQRTKPGKEVKVGSQLEIHKEPYRWAITITGINNQRRPASEAALLYLENPESTTKRQIEVEKRRENKSLLAQTGKKPNKKQRRQIHKFKQP